MKRAQEFDNQYCVASQRCKYRTKVKSNSSLGQSQALLTVNQMRLEHKINLDCVLGRGNCSNENVDECNDYIQSLQREKHFSTLNNVQCKPNTEKHTYLQQRLLSKHPSSKTNIETNTLSENHSLQYQSSQQPSFSSKGEFTVLEDINRDNHRLIVIKNNDHRKKSIIENQTQQQQWGVIGSGSGGNEVITRVILKDGCIRIVQLVQELRLIKQTLESKIRLQKSYFINEIQQLKQLLFSLNTKYEKQSIQSSKRSQKLISSRISIDLDRKQNELIELRLYCKQIESQKSRASQKYSSTLKKYQQQIEIISQELSRRINNQQSQQQQQQREQNLPTSIINSPPQQQGAYCQRCMRFQQMLQNHAANYEQQSQLWKTRCLQLQKRHKEQIVSIEEQMHKLKQQLSLFQGTKTQSQRKMKQRQRQLIYQQSQCEYREKEIRRRQQELVMGKLVVGKREGEGDGVGKKGRITGDGKLQQVLRQDIRRMDHTQQRQYWQSEYYTRYDKKSTPIQNPSKHYERSDSASSRGSKIDIKARLKEIQMIRAKSKQNYDHRMTSRKSSKDSRYSGFQQYKSARVSGQNMNVNGYGSRLPNSLGKEHQRESSESIKLADKLNKLTENLQNQLKSIN